jgi:hypothetical protein
MAHWKSGNRVEANRLLDDAVARMERGEPLLYYHLGPLTALQLRNEAQQLIVNDPL